MSRNKRILAVDDDEELLELYAAKLGALGFEVSTLSGTQGVLDRIREFRPDLILMDVMMPGQDGISLTRSLRSDGETADIPILVVSALADAATLNDALLFGAADYLVKPFGLEDLKRKVDRALSVSERRRARSKQ